MMVNPDKEKFRKILSETDNEIVEKLTALKKIDPIQDREQWQKANDEYMTWRLEKHAQLFSEFKAWVWSD
jgi:spore coat polysaccharide biosynthesis protein SpsF (cytidylyltransferase family)